MAAVADPQYEQNLAFRIDYDHHPLPDAQRWSVVAFRVDQNLGSPALAELTLVDANTSTVETTDPLYLAFLNDSKTMAIGKSLKIAVGYEEEPRVVFEGEIIEREVVRRDEHSLPHYVVRALDLSHRLQRGRKTRRFIGDDAAPDKIVEKIAKEVGITPRIYLKDRPTTLKYILQNNQTDWEFLQDLAHRTGYDIFYNMVKNKDTDVGLVCRPQQSEQSEPEITLGLWEDALELKVTKSTVDQVKTVTVRGWDPATQQAIIGKGKEGNPVAKDGKQRQPIQENLQALEYGKSAEFDVVRKPVRSQADADFLAQAVANDLTSEGVHVRMTVVGTAGLCVGQWVKLSQLGELLDGKYYINAVQHCYDEEQAPVYPPYTTTLEIGGGPQVSTLTGLIASAGASMHSYGNIPSVVIGVVESNDPDGDKNNPGPQGCIRVTFPWLGDKVISTWARLVALGAGQDRGMLWIPEIHDEVLIAFEHGDPNFPYVLGGLWNGKADPPRKSSEALSGTSVNLRTIKARSDKHYLEFDDTKGSQKITLHSTSGHAIILDDANKKITIEDPKSNTIVIDSSGLKSTITITSQGDIALKADKGNIDISGMNVSINATMQAKMSGTTTAISGKTAVDIKGAVINMGPGQ